jgi:hypothetical protein
VPLVTAATSSAAVFRLATHQVGTDVWVISLSGDCGDSAGGDLEHQLASLPYQGRSPQAVVDLSAALAVRSTLFAYVLEGARVAGKQGVLMTVVSDEASVRAALGAAQEEGALKLERVLSTGIREALIASRA